MSNLKKSIAPKTKDTKTDCLYYNQSNVMGCTILKKCYCTKGEACNWYKPKNNH